MNRSNRIYHHDISNSIEEEELAYSNSRSSYPIDDNTNILLLFPCDFQCIDESSKYYDSCPMLIIMHHRDIEFRLESLFYLKTPGCRNIFEIDSTESISNIANGFDKFFDILGSDNNRECIHITEFFE